MRHKGKHRSATVLRPSFATVAKAMVALCPLVPALIVNTEHARSQGWGVWLAAVGSILLAAGFTEASKHSEGWGMSALFCGCALILVAVNVFTALQSATIGSDHRSDHRSGEISTAKSRQSQISEWSHRRTAQALVAGDAATQSLVSELEKIKAADANRWQSTDGCKPEKITAGASKLYCAAIASAQAKVAAATLRDDLDTKIESARGKLEGSPPPQSADPYVEQMAALVTAITGRALDDNSKRALGGTRTWPWAIGLELMAAFGPAALLTMLDGMLRPRRREEPNYPEIPDSSAMRKKSLHVADIGKPITAPIAPPPVPIDDPIHGFIAGRLEKAEGDSTPAGSMWSLWLQYCAEKSLDPGTQKKFGAVLGAWFAKDNNNNRPRYLNVRPKAHTMPALRLAVSN